MYVFTKTKKQPAKRSKKAAPRARRIPSGQKVGLPDVKAPRIVERVGTAAEFRTAFLLGREFGMLGLSARGIPCVLESDAYEIYERIAAEFERIGDYLFPPAVGAPRVHSRAKEDDVQDGGQ